MTSVASSESYASPVPGAVRWDAGKIAAFAILVFFVSLAFSGAVLAPYDWTQINRDDRGRPLSLQSPSARYWMGTTNMGRDIFSQILVGTRGAMAVGTAAGVSVVTIGLLVGLFAGYFGGWVDTGLMRVVDIAYSLPLEPIAIVLLSIVGQSFFTMVLAISLLAWRGPARVLRAQVLSVSQRPYIKAARIAGAGHRRLLFVHILPDILPLTVMYLPIAFGRAVLSESAISFLGFGAPDLITWGQMLQQAFVAGAARTAWWWILAPGACISAVVVSVFFVARSFEDTFNPRLRS